MAGKNFATVVLPNVNTYTTIRKAEKGAEWYWTGAPAALVDAKEVVWIAYRVRSKEKRGHSLAIARSDDGFNFEMVKTFAKEDIGITSFERAGFLLDPVTGKFKLYPSLEKDRIWSIYKLDDVNSPDQFDITTLTEVFQPLRKIAPEQTSACDYSGVKDPYIFTIAGRYYMYYSGGTMLDSGEKANLAASTDGIHWTRSARNPLLVGGEWHTYNTRVSCVMPWGPVFITFYGGSSAEWYERTYNLQTGYAITFDLERLDEVTTSAPVLTSPTGNKMHTLRYVDWVVKDDKLIFYYEASAGDDSYELRASHVPLTPAIKAMLG